MKPRRDFTEETDIVWASWGELSEYLESWGCGISCEDTLPVLRAAARDNFETEGPGLGPVEINHA